MVSRDEPWIGEGGEGEVDDVDAGGVPAMGEKGPLMWGDAPSRPMIDGSRWWSWGMALKRCVIRLAPRRTASVATSVDAILSVCTSQQVNNCQMV